MTTELRTGSLQNLHTHTTYCDGIDTPEEMIRGAIARGFSSVGFSGHSYMHYSPGHSMSLEGTEAYRREIRALQAKYEGVFDVYCGLEFDLYSEVDLTGYDYLIGSMHYFRFGDEYVGFDRSQDEVERIVKAYFGGDGMAYAKAFYRELASLPDYGKFDILGHFDLITKHMEKVNLFDTDSPAYLSAAFEAIDALAGKIPLFEVNTGAIARGYRTTPYPTVPLLKELRARGFGAIVSSDCHDVRQIDCAFDSARELLGACGFTETYILTKKGFEAVPLR